jgi:hypothetical protein
VVLTWTDNADDELGYKIDRRKDSEDTYTLIIKTGADAATYTDETVEPTTTYFYRIRAFNEAGDSNYNTMSEGITTLDESFTWCFIDSLRH